MSTYTIETILQVIPHRFPLLLIDKVLEHQYGERALCLKNITYGEPIFTGHFPARPIYPAIFLIEMGLQATMLALTDIKGHLNGLEQAPIQGVALMVESFKFLHPVLPGDCLLIAVQIETMALGMAKARINLTCNQDIVAKGRVTVGHPREKG